MAQPGTNLKELRERRGHTLRQASAEIGVATSVLHRAERGIGTLSLANAVKIATHYGLAVADLMPLEQAA